MIKFIIGMFTGAFFGILIIAVLMAGRDPEEMVSRGHIAEDVYIFFQDKSLTPEQRDMLGDILDIIAKAR